MLDFVDDDILDHTSSDAFVYTMTESDPESDPDRNKAAILEAVILSAPDKLDQRFANLMNAREIVQKYSSDPNGDENSNLMKLLDWCWRQGTFRQIRCLSEHSFTSFKLCLMTTEILRPMSVDQGQTHWEEAERYA